PGVREAVVLAREDQPGDRRLAAYLLTMEGVKGGDLRLFLQDRLPEVMLPSAYVMLKELPLTPNGKVDRQALPPPEAAGREREGVYVAPRTPVEEVLAGMWSEVLGLERVGVHD